MGSREQVSGADITSNTRERIILGMQLRNSVRVKLIFIFVIFSEEELENSSGREERGYLVGTCTCFVLASRLLVILYNSLEQVAEESVLMQYDLLACSTHLVT